MSAQRHKVLLATCVSAFTIAACSSDEAQPPAGDGGPPTQPAERLREKLSQTGLFSDIEAKTLAADALEFEPSFPLWTDGATKKRWIRLPPGTTIDTSDPDRWKLPVGGQLFKEFSRDGKRLETRLLERVANTGKDSVDYWLGAFVWREDESDADFTELGLEDVRATSHDVPGQEACWACHNGEPGHMLGFSAVQLAGSPGPLTLAELKSRGLVPQEIVDQPLQGAPSAVEAIGYLHANCAHCHNLRGAAWPDTNLNLRIDYGTTEVTSSAVVLSTVEVPVTSFSNVDFRFRIEPGAPDKSALLFRMKQRGVDEQMPPLGSEIVDPAGVEKVATWIAAMPARETVGD